MDSSYMHLAYKIIYGVFFGALITIGALLIATLVPVPGNYEVKIVQSGSMEPELSVGELVVVKPQEQYAIGDIITFGEDTREQIPTTHRIVERQEEGGTVSFVTKGDANDAADPEPIAKSEVIGEVVFHVPYVGYVLDFARTPIGFALLIGLPAAIIILEELLNIVRSIRDMRRRKRKRMRQRHEEPPEHYAE